MTQVNVGKLSFQGVLLYKAVDTIYGSAFTFFINFFVPSNSIKLKTIAYRYAGTIALRDVTTGKI